MTETRSLLIEIGTEELPPKALANLSEAFSSGICSGLTQQQITYQTAQSYATPRRLAILLTGVATLQPDRVLEKRGPALKTAFDAQGQPTKATQGFARSCGIEVSDLTTQETDKGSWLIYRSQQLGQPTTQLVAAIIEHTLGTLPIPKRMRWSDLPFEFIRPVHWIVILFGEEVIQTNLLGIDSGRQTRGHRFHHPAPITLQHADHYAEQLELQGYVIPNFQQRREKIRQLVENIALEVQGLAVINDNLLNEVTSLVEWPVPVLGSFADNFLEVPAEALIATMQGNQKCFHLTDQTGKLLPRFIAISNLQSQQPELVRAGNERVIRPRLSDAAFFWKQDRAHSLESQLERLKTVIFQNKLGSLYDKSKRVAKLTGNIAKQLGTEELQGIRAAQLSKCDLMTNMVNEFPELQGIMGEYYARHDKETPEVAVAIREQYLPRFWGDQLPNTPLGQALSLADKLDTLVGIFGINQPPTGERDPFGLRRAAIGILRILIECQLPLDLQQLLNYAQTTYPPQMIKEDTHQQVLEFIMERIKGYYQDQHISYDVIEAVLACQPTNPLDIHHRIQGINTFRHHPDFISLAGANKRIHNILKKAEDTYSNQPDPTYFTHAAERQLYDKTQTLNQNIAPLLSTQNYPAVLRELATLRPEVDNFFDHVMVMDENPAVRKNRLAFLNMLRTLFLQIADISQLQIIDKT